MVGRDSARQTHDVYCGLAAGMDACHWPEVVGTVAGDDTIFIALRDPALGAALRRRLTSLAG